MVLDNNTLSIAQIIEKAVGIKPTGVGPQTWMRSIKKRMTACDSVNINDYLSLLHSSPGEVQALVELVVVPETWFFRDLEGLKYMASVVRKAEAEKPRKTWRCLSLGCATGEEPYSIAMMLASCGVPLLRFSVEALDVSRHSLAVARQGIYGPKAFKKPLDFAFKPFFTSESENKVVKTELRQRVAFRPANLVDASLGFNPRKYDFIFCRNVLIYFSSQTQDRVLNSCWRLLAPTGIMILSPTESETARLKGWSHAGPRLACAHPQSNRLPHKAPPPKTLPSKDSTPKTKEATVSSKSACQITSNPAKDFVSTAQHLANNGDLEEAEKLCREGLRQHSDNARLYYLLGAVQMAQHVEEEAKGYFLKAVYLQPDYYDALVNLALLTERSGDKEQARRYWERARRQTHEQETAAYE